MDRKSLSLPDKLLWLAHALPSPVGVRAFYLLHRAYCAAWKASGLMTRIRFGDIEIVAPLNHPALYWRYFPGDFNRNYVLTAKETARAKNGLIVDVGANIGDGVALLRSDNVTSPILAIEGADQWFELLIRNTRNIPDVFLERSLLGEEGTGDGLKLLVKDGTSKLIKAESGVSIVTLDRLLERYSNMPVAMLKTDTDGFDLKVLLGARGLLNSQRPVLFLEVDEGLLRDQGNSSAELAGYLSDCGYTDIAVWDNYGKWLTDRSLSQGIADLIDRYPGGLNKPYLDIAVVAEVDRHILQAVIDSSSTCHRARFA